MSPKKLPVGNQTREGDLRKWIQKSVLTRLPNFRYQCRGTVMNPIVHQAIGSTTHALPAAMVFSKQLLLTEKSSVTVEPGSPIPMLDELTVRATKITKILIEIEGYRHGRPGN